MINLVSMNMLLLFILAGQFQLLLEYYIDRRGLIPIPNDPGNLINQDLAQPCSTNSKKTTNHSLQLHWSGEISTV